MPQRIEFEGQVHEFPDTFTDADIRRALTSLKNPTSPSSPPPSSQGAGPSGPPRSLPQDLRDQGQRDALAQEAGQYLQRLDAESAPTPIPLGLRVTGIGPAPYPIERPSLTVPARSLPSYIDRSTIHGFSAFMDRVSNRTGASLDRAASGVVGSLARAIGKVSDSIPTGTLENTRDFLAKRAEFLANAAGPKPPTTTTGKVVEDLASAPGELLPVVAATAITKNPIAALAALEGAKAYGGGAPLGDVARVALEGGAMGALMHGVSGGPALARAATLASAGAIQGGAEGGDPVRTAINMGALGLLPTGRPAADLTQSAEVGKNIPHISTEGQAPSAAKDLLTPTFKPPVPHEDLPAPLQEAVEAVQAHQPLPAQIAHLEPEAKLIVAQRNEATIRQAMGVPEVGTNVPDLGAKVPPESTVPQGNVIPMPSKVAMNPTEPSMAEAGFVNPSALLGSKVEIPKYTPRQAGEAHTLDDMIAAAAGTPEKVPLSDRLKAIPGQVRTKMLNKTWPILSYLQKLDPTLQSARDMDMALRGLGGAGGQASADLFTLRDAVMSKPVANNPELFDAYLWGNTVKSRLTRRAEVMQDGIDALDSATKLLSQGRADADLAGMAGKVGVPDLMYPHPDAPQTIGLEPDSVASSLERGANRLRSLADKAANKQVSKVERLTDQMKRDSVAQIDENMKAMGEDLSGLEPDEAAAEAASSKRLRRSAIKEEFQNINQVKRALIDWAIRGKTDVPIISEPGRKTLIDPATLQDAIREKWLDGKKLRDIADNLDAQAADIRGDGQAGLDKWKSATKEAQRLKVGEWTLPDVEARLNDLKAKVGDETWSAFERAGSGHQKAMRDALQLQVKAGNMSQEFADKLGQDYSFYSPIQTLKWADASANPGHQVTSGDYVKAIKGVAEEDIPAQSMLLTSGRKIEQSRRLAETNIVRRKFADLAKNDTSGLIKEVNPVAPKPEPGMGTMFYREGGVTKALQMPQELADVMNNLGPKPMDVTLKFLGKGSYLFRLGTTGANLGFNVFNAPIDLLRGAMLSKFGLNSPLDVVRYPAQIARGFASALLGNMGLPDATYMKGLKSGVLGGTFQADLTPEAWSAGSLLQHPAAKTFMRPKGFVDLLERISNGLDEGSKLVMMQRGELAKGGIDPEVVYEARTYAGTPDSSVKGEWSNFFNVVFPFFNVRSQGTASDLGRLTAPLANKVLPLGEKILADPVASRRAILRMTPIMLGAAALELHNKIGDRDKWYQRIPENVRKNYFVYLWDPSKPENFFTGSDGNRQLGYFRFPKKEIFQVVGNVIGDAVDAAFQHDPKKAGRYAASFLSDISPLNFGGRDLPESMQTVASNLAPALRAPMEQAFNRDLFFHKNIVPDYQIQQHYPKHEQYTRTTDPVYVALGRWLSDAGVEVSPARMDKLVGTFTGSLLTQFTPGKAPEGLPTWSAYPVVKRLMPSPAVEDPLLAQVEAAQAQEGDQRAERSRAADAIAQARASGSEPPSGLDPALVSDPAVQRLAREKEKQIRKGLNAVDRQILSLGVRDGARAKFLSQVLQAAPPEKRHDLIQEWRRKGLLTPNMRLLVPEGVPK